jgi:hypothetical protein
MAREVEGKIPKRVAYSRKCNLAIQNVDGGRISVSRWSESCFEEIQENSDFVVQQMRTFDSSGFYPFKSLAILDCIWEPVKERILRRSSFL